MHSVSSQKMSLLQAGDGEKPHVNFGITLIMLSETPVIHLCIICNRNIRFLLFDRKFWQVFYPNAVLTFKEACSHCLPYWGPTKPEIWTNQGILLKSITLAPAMIISSICIYLENIHVYVRANNKFQLPKCRKKRKIVYEMEGNRWAVVESKGSYF